MSCKCENKNKYDNNGMYATEDLIERDVKDQRENKETNHEAVN